MGTQKHGRGEECTHQLHRTETPFLLTSVQTALIKVTENFASTVLNTTNLVD